MKRIARVIQSGRSSPTYYVDRDLYLAVREAVEDWSDTDVHYVGVVPERVAFDVWIDEVEDGEWTEPPDLLELGVNHVPPMAERVEELPSECEFVYQPLLVGRRVQVHKMKRAVRVMDHRGRETGGVMTIGGEERNLSHIFLAMAYWERPQDAIFDAVVLSAENKMVVTDVLRFDDIAAHKLPTVQRMALLDEIEWNENVIPCPQLEEPVGKVVARPAHAEYFSKWYILGGD